MSIILAISLFAQSIFPISGYLTSDQVDPERLVLATGAGRYQIALDTDPSSNCAQVGAGSSVVILGPVGIDLTMYALTTNPADTANSCLLFIYRKISDVPCFMTDAGACDVALESE